MQIADDPGLVTSIFAELRLPRSAESGQSKRTSETQSRIEHLRKQDPPGDRGLLEPTKDARCVRCRHRGRTSQRSIPRQAATPACQWWHGQIKDGKQVIRILEAHAIMRTSRSPWGGKVLCFAVAFSTRWRLRCGAMAARMSAPWDPQPTPFGDRASRHSRQRIDARDQDRVIGRVEKSARSRGRCAGWIPQC